MTDDNMKMKKTTNTHNPRNVLISAVLILGLMISLFSPSPVYAKSSAKLKFSKTKVTVKVGKTVKVNIKKKYSRYKIKASKKGIVKTSVKGKKLSIKGKKAGKVTITISAYSKKGKLAAKGKIKVTVKKKTVKSSSQTKTSETKNTEKTTTQTKTTQTKTPETKNTEKTTSQTKTSEEKTNQEKTSEDSGKPSKETSSYDAGEYSITKTHSGEGTFYDRESTGAANLDDYEKKYFTAAMNTYDYMNGLAGAYIEITDKDGDKINVLITDRLPDGKKGDIDLSRKAFNEIEPEVTGRMNITWKIVPFPTTEPVSFLWKPTSTQYWAEVQVRNGRYPIKKLECFDPSTNKYVELERQEYNYFTAANGLGSAGPYKFRITDFYGHVIIEDNIAINTNETPVKGTQNFPY